MLGIIFTVDKQPELRVVAASSERTLPDYDDPPVVETVLGVQFAPLQGWIVPHFGLFWNEIKGEYPHCQVQPRVPGDVDFSVGLEMRPSGGPRLEFSAAAPVRCWFFDESRTRLIQVQHDRFMHNWVKTGADQQYLHYENVRPIFLREWERFVRFLDNQHIVKPGMVQWEVTYVNQIERHKGWATFADLSSVVAPWCGGGSTGSLPAPDAVVLNVRYPIAAQAWLTVTLEPAIRNTDAKEIIQLRLTATGRAASVTGDEIRKWLDLGRQWVVSGFTDFTTKYMHNLWKRRL